MARRRIGLALGLAAAIAFIVLGTIAIAQLLHWGNGLSNWEAAQNSPCAAIRAGRCWDGE